jgi:hypothetical protein
MPPYCLRRLVWAGPVATLAAVLAALVYYGVTKALGEQYLLPLAGSASHFSPMPVSMPVIAVLVPGLLAAAFFGFLLRFARKPATVFLSVAITALILSLGGPSYLPGAAMHTKILLGGMHILAAALITGGILILSHKNTQVP